MNDDKIKVPNKEFVDKYSVMIDHICKAMDIYEDLSCSYDHPFKFEQIIEKAKKTNHWIPITWDAF